MDSATQSAHTTAGLATVADAAWAGEVVAQRAWSGVRKAPLAIPIHFKHQLSKQGQLLLHCLAGGYSASNIWQGAREFVRGGVK